MFFAFGIPCSGGLPAAGRRRFSCAGALLQLGQAALVARDAPAGQE